MPAAIRVIMRSAHFILGRRFRTFVLGWVASLLSINLFAATSVRLAWDANTEADLAGYRVYFGTVQGSYTESIDVGNQTTAHIKELIPGTTYYFAVSAYNSAHLEGEFSEPVQFSASSPQQGPLMAGSYAGLLGGVTESHLGSFSFQVSRKGLATGIIRFGGKAYPWKGTFDENGKLAARLPPKAVALGISLVLESLPNSEITGIFSAPGASITLLARNASLGRAGALSPYSGRYTAVMEETAVEDPGPPGFAVVTVSKKGRFTLWATLPDGSRCGYSSIIDTSGSVPLFVRPRGNAGGMFGWLNFRATNGGELDGMISGLKTSSIPTDINFTGARYITPIGPTARAEMLASVNGAQLTLQWPTDPSISATLGLVSGNTFMATGPGGESISFRVVPRTGMFSGTAIQSSRQPISFSGVLIQKAALGGTGRTKVADSVGRVQLEPAGGS